MEMAKIRLGISTCLLGENVRYDGGHKLDRYLRDTLGQYVEYVPVCPEVECGLGVPRAAMRLVGEPAAPRLVTVKTGVDHTARMLAWAERRASELDAEDLCGFVFKSKSPSSGMERVKVYPEHGGVPASTGIGIFARVFMAHFPLLPVEEEGRLHDPALRENFIERVFTLKRWRALLADGPGLARLVEFHTRHKLLLLAHSPRDYAELGRLVANAKRRPVAAVLDEYQTRLMAALRLRATARKNANVLQHIQGYFKERLTADEKREMLDLIDLYRRELLPLIVPLTLLRHYVRKHDQPYLRDQVYLDPHPLELQLRNHV